MNRLIRSPGVRYCLILAIPLLAFLFFFITHATVTTDAYITFRVVDNAVHGYGLRWNVAERVQVYTHPLWLLLHIPFYALWEHIFVITIALSILFNLSALIVTMATFRKPWPQTLALFLLPLGISRSFMVFSMLGLENPLTHALFAAFGWVLLRAKNIRFWLWLSLCCSLSMLSRLDTAAFYLPAFIYLVASGYRPFRLKQCVLGSLPLLLWELFSLFYYGFPLPNTAYAKLPASIIDSDALQQGLHYLLNALVRDITAVAFLFAALVLLPIYRLRFPPAHGEMRPEIAILSGIAGYSLYVLAIGGTYIACRLWSLPFFAATWLIYGVASDRCGLRGCLGLALCLSAIAVCYPSVTVLKAAFPAAFKGGIGDVWYHADYTGITPAKNERRLTPLPTVNRTGTMGVISGSGVGFFGYQAGPAVFIIDTLAITDPLLARLPNTGIAMSESIIWHMLHIIPRGYKEAVQTGALDKMDPALAAYYARLRILISGDLWDINRLTEILRFNLGEYNNLRDAYIDAIPPAPASQYRAGRTLPASQ